DHQFKALCTVLEKPALSTDGRFLTNPDRVKHRNLLVPKLQEVFSQKSTAYWQEQCQKRNIPCGPIQNVEEVTKDPQLMARDMFISAEHPTAGPIKMIGSPLKLSRTPVTYRHHPPNAGEHNE